MKIDRRSKHSAYVSIGNLTFYFDDSTETMFVDVWENDESETVYAMKVGKEIKVSHKNGDEIVRFLSWAKDKPTKKTKSIKLHGMKHKLVWSKGVQS